MMDKMRLIDAEKLLAHLFYKQEEDIDIALEIANFPTVDATPVVYCKDCKHSFILGDSTLQTEPPYKYYCKDCIMCGCEELIGGIPNVVYNDFFCGYGKKKEG